MQLIRLRYILSVIIILLWFSCRQDPAIQGTQWEKITLSFEGPSLSEQNTDNPFLDYRLDVTFFHDRDTLVIPGFYAADGNAAETSSEEGNIWQVRFRPPYHGSWSYDVSFRKGKDISVSDDPGAGEPAAFDGKSGIIEVSTSNQGARLIVDGHYLRYMGSDQYFLKGGADSPENFLAYFEFDGTYRGKQPEHRSGEATASESLHQYASHLQDWKPGDPTWQNGKGKNIIGALNYLASKGMNSVYFLTMNIEGDGKDVWPYTGYDERFRFDCSKLDQWEIVFDHMDRLGLMLHIVTQETENETLLDQGNTDYERKLYYRELIARFAHHRGVIWNMGEENGPIHFSPNGQTTQQQMDMVRFIKTHDPYHNAVVIHSHYGNEAKEEIYTPLLGFEYLDGMSIQNGNPYQTNDVTTTWRNRSREAGKPWIMNMDEVGPANRGTDPDDREDINQDTLRTEALWGNLMGGGAGIEWYFGYTNHNNDLQCEDWRSRDQMWDYTRYALNFFQDNLPFTEMDPANGLITANGLAFGFSKANEVYAIYLQKGTTFTLNFQQESGNFKLQWYNPREGGDLIDTDIILPGGADHEITPPQSDESYNDWVGLLTQL